MKMTLGMMSVAGMSMLAGGLVGMALSPKKKKQMQKAAGKAVKAAGEAMESLSGTMNLKM